MNVEEAIRPRRTIRRFAEEPVSAVHIRELLDLATHAPNVANRQMWRFIVITTPELRKMLADLVRRRIDEMMEWPELAGQTTRLQAWREQSQPFSESPALIFFVNQGYRTALDTALIERGVKHWEVAGTFGHPDVQSISAAIAFLVLAAEERGYGTCWMTAPLVAKKDLQQALELKPGEEIVAMVGLGRPAETPIPKQRKKIDEIIEWR
jgi:nitroreductase